MAIAGGGSKCKCAVAVVCRCWCNKMQKYDHGQGFTSFYSTVRSLRLLHFYWQRKKALRAQFEPIPYIIILESEFDELIPILKNR